MSTETKKSDSGIPKADFIEDVESFMKKADNDSVEAVLKRIDEMIQKYRFMEASLFQKKDRLKKQIPDLMESLQLVEKLKKKREEQEAMQTNFMLASQCSVRATIPPTDTVCLWLGANVMLEYKLEEAEILLTDNLSVARRNIAKMSSDLEFLRDQITTSEVNMARIYNYDVQRRKSSAGAAAVAGGGGAGGMGPTIKI